MYLAVLKGTRCQADSNGSVNTALRKNMGSLRLQIYYVGKGVTGYRRQNITDQRFIASLRNCDGNSGRDRRKGVLTKQFTDFFNNLQRSVLDGSSAHISRNMESTLQRLRAYMMLRKQDRGLIWRV